MKFFATDVVAARTKTANELSPHSPVMAHPAFRGSVGGAGMGALAGGLAGVGYGALSDDGSVLRDGAVGAIGGAALGAGAGALHGHLGGADSFSARVGGHMLAPQAALHDIVNHESVAPHLARAAEIKQQLDAHLAAAGGQVNEASAAALDGLDRQYRIAKLMARHAAHRVAEAAGQTADSIRGHFNNICGADTDLG